IPEIDAVLGTGEVPQIVGAIAPGAAPLPLYRRDQLERVSSGRGAKTFAERPMRSRRADPRLKPSRYMKSENAPAPSPQPPGLTGMREAPTYIYDADTPRLFATPRHYAYVKIAEGCDYKCAFCIIPTLRGAYRSRPGESIVREARSLADRGVKELLLI